MDPCRAVFGVLIDPIDRSQGEGDTVKARVLPDQPGKVVIDKIEGDNGRLSLVATDNCIGIAAIETLKLIGQPSCGVALTLHKVRPRQRAPSAISATLPARAAPIGLPAGAELGGAEFGTRRRSGGREPRPAGPTRPVVDPR